MMPPKLVEKVVGFQNFHGEVGPSREGVLRKVAVVVVLLLQVVVVVVIHLVVLLLQVVVVGLRVVVPQMVH